MLASIRSLALVLTAGFLAWAAGLDASVRAEAFVLVSDFSSPGGKIDRFDLDGKYLGPLAIGGPLDGPAGLALGPDNFLYVASFGNHKVLRYKLDGTPQGVASKPNGVVVDRGLNRPIGVAFDGAGNLLVLNFDGRLGSVMRFDRQTGKSIDSSPFITTLAGPNSITRIGKTLYISTRGTSQIRRYDAKTGKFIDIFAPRPDDKSMLHFPERILLGPDIGGKVGPGLKSEHIADGKPDLYVASRALGTVPNLGQIKVYSGTDGRFIKNLTKPLDDGGLENPLGLALHPRGNLLVVSNSTGQVIRFDIKAGKPLGQFGDAGPKLLKSPNHMLVVSDRLAKTVTIREANPAAVAHFEKKVRPLLAARCWKCHGRRKQEGGLRLDSAVALKRGGDSGPPIVPGKPNKSLLIEAVRRTGDFEMPPEKELSEQEIAVLTTWVRTGAIWPRTDASAKSGQEPQDSLFTKAEKDFWAFQKPRDPDLPRVEQVDWPTSPVDRFILANLEQKGLAPSPPADKRTLIRRVTFDLIGLPPTPDQINAFLKDNSPQAFERVVDRLLSSPHYGERWGRHWLDVVRYADTTANDGNFVMRYAFRYRNYVIDAFNRDLPYDQFVVEQLAGDLLPAADDVALTTRRAIATGFLMLGPKALAEADKEQVKMDIVDEQIDVIGRSLLGLTIACARCHDHKFDPIPTEDYYAMAGIFRSIEMLNGNAGVTSMWQEWTLPQQTGAQKRQLVELKQQISQLRASIQRSKSQPAAGQNQWEKTVVAQRANGSANSLPATAAESLVLWLDAGDVNNDGGKTVPKHNAPVKRWKDKSGKGNDVSSLPKPNDPTYASGVIGTRPVVRFADNAFQALRKENPKALPGGNSGRSLFVVTVPRNEKHNSEFLESISQVVGWGNATRKNSWNLFQFVNGKTYLAYHSNDFNSGIQSFSRNVPAIFEMRHAEDGSSGVSRSTFWKDGKLDGSFIPSPVITTDNKKPLVIGSNSFQTGTDHHRAVNDVAEVILYNRALTPPEARQVGRYLALKYALNTLYVTPIRIVAIAPEARTPTQREVLRQYYLENHDAQYKSLKADLAKAQHRFAALEKAIQPIRIMAPKEGTPKNLRLHLRGNHFKLGKEVPRRFLQIIAGEDHQPIKTRQSGRLELARWIASPENPLTARVMVNRIWQGHFGRGLVGSSDNFGSLGDRPSHPELLDWLATRFVQSGWSSKAMHRLILLSSTYRMQSRPIPKAMRIDPDNRLLWRVSRRRLEAEEIRDTLLAITGRLDRTVGGGGKSIMALFDKGATVNKKLGLVSAASFNFEYAGYQVPRRSLYLPVIRNALPEMLSVFDAADANAVTARRNETTVATQSLFMLNNALVRDQSLQLARQLLDDSQVGDDLRLKRAYVRILGREPDAEELAEAQTYIAQFQTKAKATGRKQADARLTAWQSYCQLLFCLNEFLYLD